MISFLGATGGNPMAQLRLVGRVSGGRLVVSIALLAALVGCDSSDDSHSANEAAEGDECASGTDTLEVYARKCDAAMGGVKIPDFDCDEDAGEPDGQGTVYGREGTGIRCNAPNVLNSECDPHSKFHVLHRDENAGIYIVAHCRKKNQPKGFFGDIAIIEYNKKTGATCFFQAGPANNLPGDVKAPGKGEPYPWKSPAAASYDTCVGCHDNGPFIRSPYLAQLGELWPEERTTHDPHYLPGTLASEKYGWNDGLMPYSFVGLDFQRWQAFAVSSSKATICSSCHRMGVAAVGTGVLASGTAQNFGLQATAVMGDKNHQVSKVRHGKYVENESSPIWMTPGDTGEQYADPPADSSEFSPNYAAALEIAKCAQQFAKGGQAGLDPECTVTRYARGDTCGTPVEATINGETKDPTSGWEGEWEVPLGCKDGPGCQPGFYYWTKVHGPFFQNTPSSIAIDAPEFRGTYLRIIAKDHQWVLKARLNATDIQDPGKPGPGGPGGTVGGIAFSRISSIPDPDSSGSGMASIADPDGSSPSTEKILGSPASAMLSILSGFIGNVARANGNAPTGSVRTGDRLKVTDTADTLLLESHDTSNGKNGWFSGEAWTNHSLGWIPSADYVVQEKWSAGSGGDDVTLVHKSDAKKVICYLTGIQGDWSKTRPDGMGGTTQPYAEIYTASGGDIHLRAFPSSTEPDGVSAYASCLRINP